MAFATFLSSGGGVDFFFSRGGAGAASGAETLPALPFSERALPFSERDGAVTGGTRNIAAR
tara:strand:+ start:1774 stop:1956 length:183 start_codon:yes stop_codon:yes gene_type:complete